MQWVEIMGPSGIGKSTFLSSILSQRDSRTEWVSKKEGLQEVALEKLKENSLEKLLGIYLKQSFINSKKNMIINMILDKKEAYLNESWRYIGFIEHNLNYYFQYSETNALEKTYRISLFKSIIDELCLFDLENYKKTVILDEGPFNHLPDIQNLNTDFPQLPQGFIFCHLEENINFNRIKAREKRRGRVSPIHMGLSHEELKKDINKRLAVYQKKREVLISFGLPFIDIDLEIINPEIITKANSFLNLCSKKKL